MTNNEEFLAFEDRVPLEILGSSLNVFEHECGAFRRLHHRDMFEDLPTARKLGITRETSGRNGGTTGGGGLKVRWLRGVKVGTTGAVTTVTTLTVVGKT